MLYRSDPHPRVAFGYHGMRAWQVGAEKDGVKNGIRFQSFRELDDGSKLGVLVDNTVIDGWPCKKDFIVFLSRLAIG